MRLQVEIRVADNQQIASATTAQKAFPFYLSTAIEFFAQIDDITLQFDVSVEGIVKGFAL